MSPEEPQLPEVAQRKCLKKPWRAASGWAHWELRNSEMDGRMGHGG